MKTPALSLHCFLDFILQEIPFSIHLAGCFCLSIAFTIPVMSQRIDSLSTVLENQIGSEQLGTLYELAFEYIDRKDWNTGLSYILRAEKAALIQGDSLYIAKTTRVRGQLLRQLSRMPESIAQLEKAVVIARRGKFKDEYGDALASLAIAYTQEASYDKALKCHLEVLEIRELEGNYEEIANVYNNIGVLYLTQEDYEKANDYFGLALTVGKGMREFSKFLINSSLCYSFIANFEKANEFIGRAIETCSSDCSKETRMHLEFSQGIYNYYAKNLDDASKHFIVSLELSESLDHKRFQIENLIYLAKINLTRGRKLSTGNNLLRAESLSEGSGLNRELLHVLFDYSIFFDVMGNHKAASDYRRRYIELRDRIFNSQMKRNMATLEIEFAERKNLARIASQDEIIRLSNIIIERKSSLNILIGVVGFLFLGIAIMLAKMLRDKQLVNQMLDQKVFERTRDLENTLAVLRSRKLEVDEFLEFTAKQIQAPISTIRGLSRLMNIELADHASRSSVLQLDKIVESLNDLNKKIRARANAEYLSPNHFNIS